LNYLVKVAVSGERYTIFGYKGKQVRDQIHRADVVAAMEAFMRAPRPSEAYNMGGGRASNASILECIALIEDRINRKIDVVFSDQSRKGNHICYISDTRKFERDYPSWSIMRKVPDIVDEIIQSLEKERRVG
jgi:CDP-paratose 2-epimerase